MNPTTSRKLQLIADSDRSRELLLEQATALKVELGVFTEYTRKVAIISAAAIGVALSLWLIHRYRTH